MPRPPTAFKSVTVLQFFKCIFLFEVVSPQRKFLLSLSISLQTLVGRRVHCMMWVSRAMVTKLMRVRRPTTERLFAFQLASLARSLSMMKLYTLLLHRLVRIGAPRYLPKSLMEEKPSSFSTISMFWGGSARREENSGF